MTWGRRFQRAVAACDLALAPPETAVVTDDDIAALPEPARRYLRFMRVVGRPRDRSFQACFTGRFRLRPDGAWMPCRAWQYNSAAEPARVYSMRVDVAGIVPMFAVDTYAHGRGRMEGKLLGIFPVARAEGPELDVGELTTYLNDALLVAPSMLLCPAGTWSPVDHRSFDITMADAGLTVTGRVTVDEGGLVVEFATTDRYAALPEGMVRARWTTPVAGWTDIRGRRVPVRASATWHLPAGPFTYAVGRFVPEALSFDVPPPSGTRHTKSVPRS